MYTSAHHAPRKPAIAQSVSTRFVLYICVVKKCRVLLGPHYIARRDIYLHLAIGVCIVLSRHPSIHLANICICVVPSELVLLS
jgi:hypothetical protein